MSTRRALATVALVAGLAATSAGCYGSYSAFHKVHDWNDGVTSGKVAKSAIHFALWVIPVYELAIVGDFLIFNTVEFFTDEPVFK